MKTAFLFTLLFVFNSLFSQEPTEPELLSQIKVTTSDSDKVKIYIKLHNLSFKSDLEKSEEYARQMLKYGKASNILLWENKGYLGLARCARKRRQYNFVLKYDSLSLLCTQRSGNANSIFAAKMELAKDFLDADIPSKAFPFLKECESTSKKTQDTTQIAKTEQALGWYYFKLNQNTKSIPHYRRAIKAFSKLKNEHMTAECKILLVQSLLPIGHTSGIPDLLFGALRFYKKNNSQSRQAYCYGLLGQSYFINGNAAKGIENYLDAKHLYNISNSKVEEALATIDLARTYLANKDFKKAESFAKESEAALTEMKYEYGLIIIKTFWGDFYSKKDNYVLSEQYFIQANKQAKELDFADLETDNQHYWIQQLYRQKNYKSCDSLLFSYAERAAKQREPAILANELRMILGKNKNIESNKAELLTLLYTPLGIEKLKIMLKGKSLSEAIGMNRLLVLNPFSLATPAYDSIMEMKYVIKELEMEKKYRLKLSQDSLQIAQQEVQLATQKKQIAQQENFKTQQNLNRKNIILILTSIIIILLLAGLLLLNMYKRRAERSKAEAETGRAEAEKSKAEAEAGKAEAERLKEISDEQKKEIKTLNTTIVHSTKNAFTVFEEFLNMEKEKGNNFASLETRVSIFKILIETLYNENPSGRILLEEYLKKLCTIIAEAFRTNKQISIAVNAPLEVTGKTAKALGLITNEVVTNSLKHAFTNMNTGIIKIEAGKENGDIYYLKITDNGKGINEAAKNNGGMTIIRDYADALHGKFSIVNNKGTEFNLTFPLKYEPDEY